MNRCRAAWRHSMCMHGITVPTSQHCDGSAATTMQRLGLASLLRRWRYCGPTAACQPSATMGTKNALFVWCVQTHTMFLLSNPYVLHTQFYEEDKKSPKTEAKMGALFAPGLQDRLKLFWLARRQHEHVVQKFKLRCVHGSVFTHS